MAVVEGGFIGDLTGEPERGLIRQCFFFCWEFNLRQTETVQSTMEDIQLDGVAMGVRQLITGLGDEVTVTFLT